MNKEKIKDFILKGKFLYHRPLAITLWFGLAFYECLAEFVTHSKFNNFQIYRYVFFHVTTKQNLYHQYPEYFDVNLYGPVFSALIAPFAVLQINFGAICWGIFNAAFLFFAIDKLPVSKAVRTAVMLVSSIEMMGNVGWCQVNPFIAGCIILGFVYTNNGKEIWALFFIMLAGFIKIYGLAGLAFFFFSDNKLRYIMWLIVWSLVFFCLPMLWSSPSFILQSYVDWYNAIMEKAVLNTRAYGGSNLQDICVQGMIRRIFNLPDFNSMLIIVPALVLFAAQYLRINYFSYIRFRLYLLCSALIFPVIFSSGSEGPTYIICVPALCLWYFLQPKNRSINAVFIFSVIITIFGYSDLLTPYFRKYVMVPYALKALPCLLIWLIIVYGIFTKKFLRANPDYNPVT